MAGNSLFLFSSAYYDVKICYLLRATFQLIYNFEPLQWVLHHVYEVFRMIPYAPAQRQGNC